MLSAGGAQIASTGVAAKTDSSDKNNYETKRLPAREAGQLRGEIMSTKAFKTVRQKIRELEFKPDFGDGATAIEITNTDTGETWPAFRVDCEYIGKADEKPMAILYGRKKSDEIFVRSISQQKGNPVIIHDCSCEIGDFSSADQEELTHYRIPIMEGG